MCSQSTFFNKKPKGVDLLKWNRVLQRAKERLQLSIRFHYMSQKLNKKIFKIIFFFSISLFHIFFKV